MLSGRSGAGCTEVIRCRLVLRCWMVVCWIIILGWCWGAGGAGGAEFLVLDYNTGSAEVLAGWWWC